jgi:ribosome-binding factor A
LQRSVRVGDELRTVIADLIQNDIKDPRLPALVSVTEVRASRDLSHAHVYISVLGDDEARKNCAAALKSASGYLRREVAARVRLRIAPELHFVFDESIERGIRMSRLIDEAIGDKGNSDKEIDDKGIGDKAHE